MEIQDFGKTAAICFIYRDFFFIFGTFKKLVYRWSEINGSIYFR